MPPITKCRLALGIALLAVPLVATASAARAAPIFTAVKTDFSSSPYTFGFGNGQATYTLSPTGDIFNPAAVKTTGTALVNSFGGFAGFPVTPTTNFIDRGTVIFSSADRYTAFPTTTTIPFSNGDNFLGLAFTLTDGIHYGFAEFRDLNLIGYGYEGSPGGVITAVDVPEPLSASLLVLGLAGLAAARRRPRIAAQP